AGAGTGGGPPAVRDGPQGHAHRGTGLWRQPLFPAHRPHPDAEEDLQQPGAAGHEEDLAWPEDAVRLAMRGADPPRAGPLRTAMAVITAFERSPDRGRGLARDMRVRWALEETGQDYDVRLLSFEAMKQPPHIAHHPFGQIPT